METKKHNFRYRLHSYSERAHASKLIFSVILFGAISLTLFWLTMKFGWLPIEFRSNSPEFMLTQEDTGLFEAIGGWALGFAGALVAIKIAGSAFNIQQNDSVREECRNLEDKTQRISDFNSRIARAIFDAKRACTAVLIEASPKRNNNLENFYRSEYQPSNDAPKLAESVQQHLIGKLDALIAVIEEASRDQTYRSALKIVEKLCKEKSTEWNLSTKNISDYFENSEMRKEMLSIVEEDSGFYDFTAALRSASANFGVGVNHLRSENIHRYYRADIEKLLWMRTNTKLGKSDNAARFEYSHAAWLLLGMLLLQHKDDAGKNHNHGFILLALILGSLPTRDSVKAYLEEQTKGLEYYYSKTGHKKLADEIEDLAEELYYLTNEDLREVATLLEACNGHVYWLDIISGGDGLSQTESVSSKPGDERDGGEATQKGSHGGKGESGSMQLNEPASNELPSSSRDSAQKSDNKASNDPMAKTM